jgi:hypothetical protein
VPRLLIGIPLALALCLSVGIGPALADVDIFTTGTVGEHSLKLDVPEAGGAICFFNEAGPDDLWKIKMRPPLVYAIDRDGGRNQQMVGWRLIIDRSGDGMPAKLFHKSKIQKQIAYDDQPARFTAKFAAPVFPDDDSRYRVFAKMFWYRADGTIEGASVHVVTQYRQVVGDAWSVVYGNCHGIVI